MKEVWIQINYFFGQTWAEMWPIKAPLSLAMAYYSSYLCGDWVLLVVFSAMVVIDLVFGTWLAMKTCRFEVRLFGRWVVKVGTHFFVIAIVGLAIKSVLVPLSIGFPLLDLFLGLLICTEALSVLKNMQKLGLPVPKLATKMLTNVQTKAEQKAEDFFCDPVNDRRRRPKPETDKRPEPTGKAYDFDDQD